MISNPNLSNNNNKNDVYGSKASFSKISTNVRRPVGFLVEYKSIEIASMQVTYTKRLHTMNYKAHCAIRVLSYEISEIQSEVIQMIESLVADQFTKINIASKKINISCDVKK